MYLEPGHWLSLCYVTTKNSENFETGTNGVEISGKGCRKSGIVEFLKSEPLGNGLWKFLEVERKFPTKHFRKFRYTSQGCHGKFRKFSPRFLFIELKTLLVTCFPVLKFAIAERIAARKNRCRCVIELIWLLLLN